MGSAIDQALGPHALFNQSWRVVGLAFKAPYVRKDIVQIQHHQRTVRQQGPCRHFLRLVAVAVKPSGVGYAINMFSAHGSPGRLRDRHRLEMQRAGDTERQPLVAR
ncbi:hypothetical protein D3C72_1215260 [compost metagenome]